MHNINGAYRKVNRMDCTGAIPRLTCIKLDIEKVAWFFLGI